MFVISRMTSVNAAGFVEPSAGFMWRSIEESCVDFGVLRWEGEMRGV